MATNGADPSVAIFWDYENVQVPSDFPAYRVVEELRRLALNYGKLSMYRAYLDTDFMKGPRGLATRGDLQTGGVTIADTPHRNRKEVADVMIISDMLEFGLLTLNSVVILVTGDRGFSYPCQRLIDNRRTVVLVTPDTTSASNRLKESVTRVLDYRCELLGLPARQNSYRYSQEPVPMASRSMSQSRASTSRMPVARPASLPPTYEEFAPLRPSRRDTERRNASTSRPINPIPSTSSARSKGKSKAAQQRPIPPPPPTKPTETLTLSDDDEDEDEDDLVQQMLAPAVRSVSIISTDSVLASPTLSKPRNPSFAPAFPSAATSNLLQPPVNRSRSRSTDPESKSVRRLPSPAPSDIQEEEDEDFDSLLIGGSKSARKGSGSSGKTASSKKRGLESEGESAKKKKKRTSLSSATKKEKRKETRSEDIDMFGSNEVPILVISDDEDE